MHWSGFPLTGRGRGLSYGHRQPTLLQGHLRVQGPKGVQEAPQPPLQMGRGPCHLYGTFFCSLHRVTVTSPPSALTDPRGREGGGCGNRCSDGAWCPQHLHLLADPLRFGAAERMRWMEHFLSTCSTPGTAHEPLQIIRTQPMKEGSPGPIFQVRSWGQKGLCSGLCGHSTLSGSHMPAGGEDPMRS